MPTSLVNIRTLRGSFSLVNFVILGLILTSHSSAAVLGDKERALSPEHFEVGTSLFLAIKRNDALGSIVNVETQTREGRSVLALIDRPLENFKTGSTHQRCFNKMAILGENLDYKAEKTLYKSLSSPTLLMGAQVAHGLWPSYRDLLCYMMLGRVFGTINFEEYDDFQNMVRDLNKKGLGSVFQGHRHPPVKLLIGKEATAWDEFASKCGNRKQVGQMEISRRLGILNDEERIELLNKIITMGEMVQKFQVDHQILSLPGHQAQINNAQERYWNIYDKFHSLKAPVVETIAGLENQGRLQIESVLKNISERIKDFQPRIERAFTFLPIYQDLVVYRMINGKEFERKEDPFLKNFRELEENLIHAEKKLGIRFMFWNTILENLVTNEKGDKIENFEKMDRMDQQERRNILLKNKTQNSLNNQNKQMGMDQTEGGSKTTREKSQTTTLNKFNFNTDGKENKESEKEKQIEIMEDCVFHLIRGRNAVHEKLLISFSVGGSHQINSKLEEIDEILKILNEFKGNNKLENLDGLKKQLGLKEDFEIFPKKNQMENNKRKTSQF